MVAVRKDYAAPTELEPMRMTNYKDAAPTALKMPPGTGARIPQFKIRHSSFVIPTSHGSFRFSFWDGRLG